jgi:hypothetical protein
VWCRLHSPGWDWSPVAGCCEHCNELPGSMKAENSTTRWLAFMRRSWSETWLGASCEVGIRAPLTGWSGVPAACARTTPGPPSDTFMARCWVTSLDRDRPELFYPGQKYHLHWRGNTFRVRFTRVRVADGVSYLVHDCTLNFLNPLLVILRRTYISLFPDNEKFVGVQLTCLLQLATSLTSLSWSSL